MNDNTTGTLDGQPARLGDVPKERRAEWVTMVDGKAARPFRFVDTDAAAVTPRTVTR